MKKTIDDCFFQIQNGANIKQGDVDGGFPITRIETTANDKFNRDRMGYAGITDISKYESYVLEDGDLLMSHINSVQYLGRTVLYVKQTDETIIHGMNLLRLKARRDVINPAYARYCFYGNPFRRQVRKITKKSVNQASFAVKDLKQIKIDVPSLLEQEQIVEVLDKLQKIIEIRSNELSTLDELIKARFVEMFGDPRSNPFSFDEWMLKDTCKVVTGNTPSRAVSEYYGNYVEWIKTDNIVSGLLNPTKATECLSEKGMEAGRIVERDSILMACIAGSIASIGRVCVTDRTVAFNQQINAVVPEKYNVLFLYVLLQISKDYLVEDVNMALKGILSKSKLEEKKFIVPPIELQNQFADFVKQVNKSKVAVQKSLDETKLLFDSLMQQYFG
ncbi:restriction endonuclease subunit S [Firmicutes bacterium AM31-12AC]|nr:restriction endonuclease subunit S [Firmicutes bacterium AM31-12AC]